MRFFWCISLWDLNIYFSFALSIKKHYLQRNGASDIIIDCDSV